MHKLSHDTTIEDNISTMFLSKLQKRVKSWVKLEARHSYKLNLLTELQLSVSLCCEPLLPVHLCGIQQTILTVFFPLITKYVIYRNMGLRHKREY